MIVHLHPLSETKTRRKLKKDREDHKHIETNQIKIGKYSDTEVSQHVLLMYLYVNKNNLVNLNLRIKS